MGERLAHAVVAPAIAIGASGEHAGFPGTLSIGTPALVQVLVEAVRSLADWAARCVIVNGHGGNRDALQIAVPQLRADGHDVALVSCGLAGADAHAGAFETSLMLAIAPQDVLLDRAVAGDTRPIETLMTELRARGVRAVSPNGVLGDPAGASRADGERQLAALIAAGLATIAGSSGGAG